MPLQIPKLNDLTYEELLREVLDRVPVHNPEWTNLSESDPGVTLLELFAFLTERLLSRANQIPERNRLAFLSLLGIPLRPAQPARALVTFANVAGDLKLLVIPAGLELQAGPMPFRSTAAVEVLPVEAMALYKAPVPLSDEQRAAYARKAGLTDAEAVQVYQTRSLPALLDGKSNTALDLQHDTVDGTLWIALFARAKDGVQKARQALGDSHLNLGVLPVVPDERVLRALDWLPNQPERLVPLHFEIATTKWDEATGAPIYQRLPATLTGDLLQEPGVATLRLPPAAELGLWQVPSPQQSGVGDLPPVLDDPKLAARLITFIRVRLAEGAAGDGVRARLFWAGINAAMAVQKATVEMEQVGTGTGEPGQSVRLVHTNIIPESVVLRIDGEPWQRIADLSAAGSEVTRAPLRRESGGQAESKVFTLDPESGLIRFGDGLRGARPPRGAAIRVSYAYGGGREGNVPAGAVSRAASLPPGVKVINPGPAWGGMDAERPAEAERSIAAVLSHRDRLVTADDFQEIIRRTPGVDIGRIEVLPRFNPDLPDRVVPGAVTVLAIPAGQPDDEISPVPDPLFLDLIARQIEPRRLITTEVFVRGPEYMPVTVSIGVEVVPGYDFPEVKAAVSRAIRHYLSPLYGGRDGTGWPLGRWVTAKELFGIAARVAGVSYVVDVELASFAGPQKSVHLTGLQLPWLAAIETHHGEPLPVARAATALPAGTRRGTPVPVSQV
ncbi:MAG TPA: putative baseplate assembly protein [Symbiobacteriaceae bacterium]|nr:putative baseplate assembly protein [Symbiobacteriaceae bacterium]